ncbi:hypothetical protein QFZ76_006545 [Streptomyces sp. V4I2]|nr:hypothetical protein [Streptomyces sp. V4I2]
MRAPSPLLQEARTRLDRLKVLTALIGGPEFDPVLRGGVLKIPPAHPVYPWNCTVSDCARSRWRRYAMCSVHADQWQEAEARGMSRSHFLRAAEPLLAAEAPKELMCRICPQRPAFSLQLVLCFRHRNRWLSHLKRHPGGRVHPVDLPRRRLHHHVRRLHGRAVRGGRRCAVPGHSPDRIAPDRQRGPENAGSLDWSRPSQDGDAVKESLLGVSPGLARTDQPPARQSSAPAEVRCRTSDQQPSAHFSPARSATVASF